MRCCLTSLLAYAGVAKRVLLWMAILLPFYALPGYAQDDTAPVFAIDVVNVQGDDDSGDTRVDLYTKIPYSNLQFLQSDDAFEARYVVNADVYYVGEEGEEIEDRLVVNRVWERTVQAPAYQATRAETVYDATTQSVSLPPGRYLVIFQLEDQASRSVFTRETFVRVRDLSGDVAVSDLILLESYDPSTNTISPLVTHRIRSDSRQLALFFEMYARDSPRNVSVTRSVYRGPQHAGLASVKQWLGLGGEGELEEVYRLGEQRELLPGRTQSVVRIPLAAMRVGEYVVRVTVESDDGEVLDSTVEPFTLQWSGLTAHIQSLDDAVSQLQYIAKQDQIDWIRAGESDSQRFERFQSFWSQRDPTPGTGRNERMEEYYYRVAYANREYGSLRDGWRTDRGQVLVLFGEPDYVDRHPYDFSSDPYEIWYYYRVGKRFVFVDETGFGNYQLIVPIWDDRTRLR